jgi:transcription antitermination factor NusG
MDGVRDMLLGMNGQPAPVRDLRNGVPFVEFLMADDERRCDLAHETMPPLKTGARVVIEEGAFASFHGMVLACNGITTTVDVEMFGRLVPVHLDRSAVIEAEAG